MCWSINVDSTLRFQRWGNVETSSITEHKTLTWIIIAFRNSKPDSRLQTAIVKNSSGPDKVSLTRSISGIMCQSAFSKQNHGRSVLPYNAVDCSQLSYLKIYFPGRRISSSVPVVVLPVEYSGAESARSWVLSTFELYSQLDPLNNVEI